MNWIVLLEFWSVIEKYPVKFGILLRLEDGTKCSLRTVEFCGLDTQTDEVS